MKNCNYRWSSAGFSRSMKAGAASADCAKKLARVGRKPYIVWIFGLAGGEGYCEADTKEEAFAAAYAFNWREEYAAQVYGPHEQSLQEEYKVYDRETFAKSDLAKWIEQRVAQRKARPISCQ